MDECSDDKPNKGNVFKHMMCAGFSGCVTECIVLPVDTVKARLMMDESKLISPIKHFNKAFAKLWKEGIHSFFKGLSAGLQRQIVFASTRIGLYDPVFFFIL